MDNKQIMLTDIFLDVFGFSVSLYFTVLGDIIMDNKQIMLTDIFLDVFGYSVSLYFTVLGDVIMDYL